MPFAYEGAQLRTLVVEGEPAFIANDVCTILDIRNSRDALARLDDDEKGVVTTDTLGGPQQMAYVTEAGLYGLVFTSRKTEARTFKRWVTHEVLPTIRKTGSYGIATSIPADYPAALEEAARQARRAIEAEAKIAELEPRAEVAAKLLDADGDLSVRDAAQALTRAGVKTGQGRLFAELYRRHWISRAGDGRWRVIQSAIETGYMSVLPQSHYHPKTGDLVMDPPQPRVTPKGLQRLLSDLSDATTPALPIGGTR